MTRANGALCLYCFTQRQQTEGLIVWEGSYELSVTQWGVGHGGFHSQSLLFQELDRSPSTTLVGKPSLVRVIYDCGSGRNEPRTALKDAVKKMLKDVAEKSKIDLLVISHFDQDHVNGLDHLSVELLKKNIKVDRVWAPVLTKIEALVAIATSGLTGAPLQQYATLLNDPSGRLSELFEGVEVTEITPGNDGTIPLPPSGTGTEDADTDGDGQVTLTPTHGGQGLVAKLGTTPAGEALWEFQPYAIESTMVGAKAVSALVGQLLGKPIEECSLEDLIKVGSDANLLAEFYSVLVQDHTDRASTTRTSSARTGPNLSSLCVYSGPVLPYDWCRFRRGWDPADEPKYAKPIAPAWFGTGDAGLLTSEHVDAMRTVLTQSRLDRVGISSAPHHGSRLDSDAPLWDALPNARHVTIEANNSTGGTGNNHPHKEVLDELATRNLAVHYCIDGVDFFWRDKRTR